MKIFTCFLVLVLVSTTFFAQNKTNSSILVQEFDDEVYKELSLSEWKKFKSFEKRLAIEKYDKLNKEHELRSYTRDSIQILGVKLMAIKLLDEKKLLEKDIVENSKYYTSLLDELRESAIPQSEYLFLEEKMAYLNQEVLEQRLGQSRWLNFGLIVLCMGLVYFAFNLKIKQRKTTLPELSKQELTVRNMILQGKSNKEIANELFISLSTVKSHITNLYAKLSVTSRQELFQKSTGTST